jgi:hypothetical protein
MKSLALGLAQDLHLSEDETEAYRSIIAAVKRFEARSAGEFAAAMHLVKPKSKKTRPSSQVSSAQAAAFFARLDKAKSDPQQTQRILDEMKGLLKPDVVEVARRLGVRTNSKTTKAAALQGIATLTGRTIRERELAERIRGGA